MAIIITLDYLNKLVTDSIIISARQRLRNREFSNPKVGYWINRALKFIDQEMRTFLDQRNTIIDKYTIKYQESGEEVDKNGNLIRRWKKGDRIQDISGNIRVSSPDLFNNEMNELLKATFELPINLIPYDLNKEPSLTPAELELLDPLITVLGIEGQIKEIEEDGKSN